MPMDTKSSAKDFFIHIATTILLFVGTVALLNLLFRVINAALPQVEGYGYFFSSISLPVATLIVVFPLFLFLTNLLRRSYGEAPERKNYAVRKWLIYITLFLAGAALAADLVTLIYYFLDGRDLTGAFLLKVLSVLVVAGAVFGYHLDALKDRLIGSRKTFWQATALILVLGSIVLGFGILGTPENQRSLRYDAERVSDLQNIQWQIVNFWQQKGLLPETLSDLEDPISGFALPQDPESGEVYEYLKTGETSFDLCTVFNKPFMTREMETTRTYPGIESGSNWQHGEGKTCFSRSIDIDLYPIRKNL